MLRSSGRNVIVHQLPPAHVPTDARRDVSSGLFSVVDDSSRYDTPAYYLRLDLHLHQARLELFIQHGVPIQTSGAPRILR